jgi:hypothetical protein
MKRLVAAFFAPMLLATTVFAQGGEHAPQPAPEIKKLDYFAGNWHTEAEMKASPMGAGGKYTSTDSYDWQKGNFFIVGHVEYKSAIGDGTELTVMGYDPTKKVYTYDAFNSSGEHQTATGTLEGDTWTWSAGTDAPFKWRYIEKLTSPKSFSIRFEVSQDGSTWNAIMEGKSTKQ